MLSINYYNYVVSLEPVDNSYILAKWGAGINRLYVTTLNHIILAQSKELSIKPMLCSNCVTQHGF